MKPEEKLYQINQFKKRQWRWKWPTLQAQALLNTADKSAKLFFQTNIK
jgi:hypothetical protein